MRCATMGFVLAAALGGCASMAPVPADDDAKVAVAVPFDVRGRISARRGPEGLAANFAWSHSMAADQLDLATPMGQVVARLSGDSTRVQVERGNGQTDLYPDWNALTSAVFGVTIPVEELSWWIRGVPRGGVPFGAERDDRGRLLTLRQRGWEIVYAYRDDIAAARPYRLVLRSADADPIEVRVVVDQWES